MEVLRIVRERLEKDGRYFELSGATNDAMAACYMEDALLTVKALWEKEDDDGAVPAVQ